MNFSIVKKDIAEIEAALSSHLPYEKLVELHRKIDCKYHQVIPDIGHSLWGYNNEFGFNYEMIGEDAICENLSSMKYKLEGFIENQSESNEPTSSFSSADELSVLISQIPIIRSRFKSETYTMFSGSNGKGGMELKTIYKDALFLEWAAKVQMVIDSLPSSSVKSDIMKLLRGFNGWSDEKSFDELSAKLKAIQQSKTSESKELSHEEMCMNDRIDDKKVFVVHGRKEAVRDDVELFLRRIGLEPIILCNQADGGLTIIEKIEEYTDVGFAVVLYTGCDMGKLYTETNFRLRARQNVVFEHGYLIAKLSRKNVVALVEPEVEIPGDLAGVLYISLEGQDWRSHVMRELKNCGFQFDWSKV